jgi:hypothetical protein
MTFTLIKSVEDVSGRIHRPGELVRLVHQRARAGFDPRVLFTVAFKDNSAAVVFAEEIKQSLDNNTDVSAVTFP